MGRLAWIALTVVCLAACSDTSTEAPPTAQPSQSRQVPAQFIEEPPSELIEAAGVSPALVKPALDAAKQLDWRYYDVDGMTYAAACFGSGVPTVVYLNGLLVPAAWTWPLIAQEQAKTNRVCVYDRAGTGLSVRRPDTAKPNGPEANAHEMFALMDALGEQGPFLLVGWSYGGIVARTAAALEPSRISGVEFVDSVLPDQYRTFDVQGWQEAGQELDMKRAEEIIGDGPKLGSKPVVVLVADHSDEKQLAGTGWDRGQRLAARMSTNSIYAMVSDSKHTIPQEHPQAAVAATTAMSQSANSGKPMPRCPATFSSAGLTCLN